MKRRDHACRRRFAVLAVAGFLVCGAGPANAGFVHPGLLHAKEDLARMHDKVHAGKQPWRAGYARLLDNPHSSLSWVPHPSEVVIRGGENENYKFLFEDIAAAYALALRYHVSGDTEYAGKAVSILNAWSSTLKKLDGGDRFLAAGIYGYEFANAAELMRDYPGWKPEDFKRFQNMMLEIFAPLSADFLEHHNGSRIDHFFANWDLCNMCALLSIGVLCDKGSMYRDAVEYFKHGGGNGAIDNAVNVIHPGGLGQLNESGRDQGHSGFVIALLGSFCEMAWNQGDDLYGYHDNRVLAGATYFARYNLDGDVPYTPYKTATHDLPVISPDGRGNIRPNWEMIYNHYANRRGLDVPDVAAYAEKVRPEGGGGDYGPTSGGYDQLGYGTLAFTRDPARRGDADAAKIAPAPAPVVSDALLDGKVIRLPQGLWIYSAKDPGKRAGFLKPGAELTILEGTSNGMLRVRFKSEEANKLYEALCRRSDLGQASIQK